MRFKTKEAKGITLIALVITIIVLLILAGVTIATLTGDNGILNQAGKAKDKTTEAEAIERVKVEVAGSYRTDGKIDPEQLKKNLGNITGLTYDSENFSLPSTVSLNGYDILIDANGNVTKKVTVSEAKMNRTVFGDNATIYDTYENQVKVPAGFKIASDSATDVTGGIVIEDSTYSGTMGSQFVWIPVGDIYTDEQRTEANKKTITLERCGFIKNSDGTITTCEISGNLTEDTESSHGKDYGNAIAKDIEKFKESTSVNKNGGYYIGRYEAGITGYDPNSIKTSCRDWETNWTGYTNASGKELQLVCKSGQQVWNYVTQKKASLLSRNMYDNTVPFSSDLINSYAWDTAIMFIQTFGIESNSATYSYQVGQLTDTSKPSTTGSGILSNPRIVDRQCNIFDMAGNYSEWTTETGHDHFNPATVRGGCYFSPRPYTATRGVTSVTNVNPIHAFRPILYLQN